MIGKNVRSHLPRLDSFHPANALIPCTWKRRLRSDILSLFLCVDADLNYPTIHISPHVCQNEINLSLAPYLIWSRTFSSHLRMRHQQARLYGLDH